MTPEQTNNGPVKSIDFTKESLKPEVEKWMEFNADYVREFGEHERIPELLEKRAEAERLLKETELLYSSTEQSAPEQIQKNWERLKVLYFEANALRTEMVMALNRTVVHAAEGQDLGAAIEADVSQANFPPQTLKNLRPIMQGLGIDAASVTAESKNRLNRYFDREHDGELNINIATVRADLKVVNDIRQQTQDPTQHAVLDRLTSQLVNLEKIDPMSREAANAGLQNYGPGINNFWRKALLGIGIVYTAWAAAVKNWKFAIPAGFATFFLWRGFGNKEAEKVSYLNQTEIQQLFLRTFNSERGAQAVEEYFSVMRGSNPRGKELWKLAKQNEITDVQLHTLYGDEQSVLKDELLKIKPGDRAKILRVLGGVTDKKAQDITVQYIKVRSTPTPTAAPEIDSEDAPPEQNPDESGRVA